jgi:hypothetical protein
MSDLFMFYGAIILALWVVPFIVLIAGKRK